MYDGKLNLSYAQFSSQYKTADILPIASRSTSHVKCNANQKCVGVLLCLLNVEFPQLCKNLSGNL